MESSQKMKTFFGIMVFYILLSYVIFPFLFFYFTDKSLNQAGNGEVVGNSKNRIENNGYPSAIDMVFFRRCF